MNGKFLLDTNILIALFKHEKAIIEKLSEVFYGPFLCHSYSFQMKTTLKNRFLLCYISDFKNFILYF